MALVKCTLLQIKKWTKFLNFFALRGNKQLSWNIFHLVEMKSNVEKHRKLLHFFPTWRKTSVFNPSIVVFTRITNFLKFFLIMLSNVFLSNLICKRWKIFSTQFKSELLGKMLNISTLSFSVLWSVSTALDYVTILV